MGWRYLLFTLGAFTLVLWALRFLLFTLEESPRYLATPLNLNPCTSFRLRAFAIALGLKWKDFFNSTLPGYNSHCLAPTRTWRCRA